MQGLGLCSPAWGARRSLPRLRWGQLARPCREQGAAAWAGCLLSGVSREALGSPELLGQC